jgi:hypothetical protein
LSATNLGVSAEPLEKAGRSGAEARGTAAQSVLPRRRVHLDQRLPWPTAGELDAARAALQQFDADLQLQVAYLPTERRLSCMQPPLRSICEAALLGHGDEIAQVPQFHSYTHTLKAWLEHTRYLSDGNPEAKLCGATIPGDFAHRTSRRP